MIEIQNQNRSNFIIQCYEETFKKKFQHTPIISDDDRNSVRGFAGRWSGNRDQARALVEGFLELDDEWLRNAGYPLKFLESRINAVWVNRPNAKPAKTLFVVGLSESGYPVTSHIPEAVCVGFDVVTWEEWERSLLGMTDLHERVDAWRRQIAQKNSSMGG